MSDQPEPTTPDLPNPATAALLAWLFPGAGHFYQGRRTKGALFMASIVGLFAAGMVIGDGKVAYASTLPFTPIGSYAYDGWPFLCQSGIGAVAIPGWLERSRYLGGEGPLLVGTLYPPPTGDNAARVASYRNQLASLVERIGGEPERLAADDRREYIASLDLEGRAREAADELLDRLLAAPGAAESDGLMSVDQAGNLVRHPDGPAKRRYDLGFRFEVGMVYTVIAGLMNLLVVYDAHSGPMLVDEEEEEKRKERSWWRMLTKRSESPEPTEAN